MTEALRTELQPSAPLGTGSHGFDADPPLGWADPISDEELAALALADDPEAPLAPDAVPLHVYLELSGGPLPDWYMPQITARHSGRRRRLIIVALIGAFLLIEAFGLCSTYGQPPFH
jgi:hypothetical protein